MHHFSLICHQIDILSTGDFLLATKTGAVVAKRRPGMDLLFGGGLLSWICLMAHERLVFGSSASIGILLYEILMGHEKIFVNDLPVVLMMLKVGRL